MAGRSSEPEIPDTLDRFFNVKMNLMAGDVRDSIGGGTAAFVGFAPQNKISIHFKAIDKYTAETAAVAAAAPRQRAGCKQLAPFKTERAAVRCNTNCASCHAGGDQNAKSAMDLTGIGSTDDTTLQSVCNQVRTRINFQRHEQPRLLSSPPTPVSNNHPFKFGGNQANFDAFKAAMDPWVQAEKTSQSS